MGTKRRVKEVNLAVEHIVSKAKIKTAKCCQYCPLKLYVSSDDDTIIFGTGNIITDTIMILPSYDVKAGIGYTTMLKIVQDAYKDITGRELLEDVYVTRAIKCLNKTDFNLEKEAIKSCFSNLFYEIGRISPPKLIVFDRLCYNILFNYNNNGLIKVIPVISPGVMYYDNNALKERFIDEFKQALL